MSEGDPLWFLALEARQARQTRVFVGGIEAQDLRALRKQEIAIARSFSRGGMWPYPVAALVGITVWLALFPLTMLGMIGLIPAMIIASVIATCGYIIGHEAMHGNIARKGEKLHWLNELTGNLATFQLAFPLSVARLLHLEHHRHCNHPEKDPDYADEAPNWWMAIYRIWCNRQPGKNGAVAHYTRILGEIGTPEARRAVSDFSAMHIFYVATMFAMAWSGFALEALVVWFIPRHFALSYIRFFLSWAPHHPREGRTGRYENTNVFKSRFGHILSMGMQYHIVHHLYPNIPNHRTKPAYYAMKPILAARGVDVSPL